MVVDLAYRKKNCQKSSILITAVPRLSKQLKLFNCNGLSCFGVKKVPNNSVPKHETAGINNDL